ncbi:uncharacterized protein LOC127130693 [Lathyrus oleraceus]|uniref:uncharacterized protein LOC127130693 n=1 Tax=Pisum sativum TaxID=3888 RepID=UPI0021CEF7E9|nr:uncharacterized protein LOC127130693 [Pisum sativum]
MVSEPKGVYNKTCVFNGENYGYWRDCMRVHINYIDRNVWNSIQNGPFEITMTNTDGAVVPKSEAQLNVNDEKIWPCYCKGTNILILALGFDEYYRVSHCTTTKVMWDSLQVAHEGINEVKQARINPLNQEFELFHMNHGETIFDMQKRFTDLVNYLNALGNPVSNEIATNKILRCLNRERYLKVMIIKEANNLLTLDTTTLFGKLEEHNQEIIFLEKQESKVKKENNKENEVDKKSIALVASSSKSLTKEQDDSGTSDDECSDDEEMRLFVKRYHKYIKRNIVKHSDKNLINYIRHSNTSREDENKKQKSKGSCYNCGRAGYYKPDFSLLKKYKGKGHHKKSNKPKRAYIAWESGSESSSEGCSSESDETVNFFLMAHHKKKNVSHSKYEAIDKMSYSDLQIAFENLHGEAVEAFKRLDSNKRIFSYLEPKF